MPDPATHHSAAANTAVERLRRVNESIIFSQMAIQYTEALDRTFHALGDGSRRRMLAAISRKSACSAGELCALFESSQPTISKHLRVLEQAQLISRRVEGRCHVFTLRPSPMAQARAWLERHHAFWEGSLDQLEGLLEELKRVQEGNAND